MAESLVVDHVAYVKDWVRCAPTTRVVLQHYMGTIVDRDLRGVLFALAWTYASFNALDEYLVLTLVVYRHFFNERDEQHMWDYVVKFLLHLLLDIVTRFEFILANQLIHISGDHVPYDEIASINHNLFHVYIARARFEAIMLEYVNSMATTQIAVNQICAALAQDTSLPCVMGLFALMAAKVAVLHVLCVQQGCTPHHITDLARVAYDIVFGLTRFTIRDIPHMQSTFDVAVLVTDTVAPQGRADAIMGFIHAIALAASTEAKRGVGIEPLVDTA